MQFHLAALLCLLLAMLSGCGQSYSPVNGTIQLPDGSPLSKGLIVFSGTAKGKSVSARGYVQTDGRFSLGAQTSQGGVPPGRYKALINPLDLLDIPHVTLDLKKPLPFHQKYLSFNTSDLEFDIQPGANEFSIKLDPPHKSLPGKK